MIHKSSIRACLASALAAIAGTQAVIAAGAPVGSSYSTIAARNCWSASGKKDADDQSSRICRGKVGLVVSVNVGDMRETISVGHDRTAAEKEPAAQAFFGPFSFASPTLEWRMAGSEPFAIIQRWDIDDNADQDKNGRPKPKHMLIVTRLPPGAVCHVAYVDVAANPNANELARQAADAAARDFKCGQDKVKVLGKSGRAVELATQR
jgi:hypothetical protein